MNNYEKWCDQWRIQFLHMNQSDLQKRLPELTDEGQWLTLRHYGRKLGINKADGSIHAMEDNHPVSCCEKLNIYTLFGYVSPNAAPTGKWVKFDQLKDASPFSKAFDAGIIAPFARTFDGHAAQLAQACCQLHGRRISQSDVGFELDAFGCIGVQFLFWDGDEEFPAQGNLLFDKSATDFIHVESIVTIAALGLSKLAEAANLPLDPSCFPVL